MLIDVTLMRRDGEKLSPEAIHQARPVRGRLSISANGYAALAEPTSEHPTILMSLHRASIRSFRGDEFVVLGEQPPLRLIYEPGNGMRQAWWCRVIVDVPNSVTSHLQR